MIHSEQIEKLVLERIESLDNKEELFIVDIRVQPGNIINVFIDSDRSIDISDCVKISRHIESNLNREVEDYELTVSSYGLDQSIIMPRQFKKHIGRTVRFVMQDKEDFNAEILSVDENLISVKTVPKKKKELASEKTISIDKINKAKLVITFQ